MLREAIKEAATVEEAKQAAATELGISEGDLQYEVLQMPQKKTLGLFGGCPAKVRAYYEITPAARASEYLSEVLRGLGVENPVITATEEENGCVLMLSGDDLGFIIGRRGDTLDALQYLTGLVANRVDNAYYRVTLDIGNYREKREQSLTGLAKKIAGQAARTGRKTSLEPMNPYERRIIHTAVQEVKGATSWSIGTEPNRYVVIGPSEDNPVRNRPPRSNNGRGQGNFRGGNPNRGQNRGNGNGERPARPPRDNNTATGHSEHPEHPDRPERPERKVREFVPRSNPLPTADGATPPSRTLSEKEQSSTLYGRIDL